MRTPRGARFLLGLASLVVPGHRRGEWMEEWRAELDALMDASARGVGGLPSPVGFAAGAFPHALWMRTEGWTMESLLQDVRYSLRVLGRAPGFTAVAALTLALGIGANAAIFSLVNGLVLRDPAGVEEPRRLVQIARSYETAPRWDNFSYPAMEAIGDEGRALSGVAGYSPTTFVLGEGMETEQVAGQYVTGNYFELLGVVPRAGRLLQPSDDLRPGEHTVVVLSHDLWTRRFGGDPRIVGQTVPIGARPYQVVGVAPAGFTGIENIGTPPDLFVPIMQDPGYRGELLFDEWGASWIYLVGRLAEDVSFGEAQASMSVVSARLRDASSVNEGIEVLLAQGVGLDPDDRREARQLSLILALIVGVVLLLTCTNVANLFLARAASRRTEVGIRMALGAGRGRLARQLLTESVLLALAATALAAPLLLLAGDLLPTLFPYRLSVSVDPDLRVYGFLVAIGLAAGLAFGAAPAWAAVRRSLTEALRDGSTSGAPPTTRLRDALVVAQISLSLGLVAAAGLLGRSVSEAQRADAGFRAQELVAAVVDLSATGRYDQEAGQQFFRDVLGRASAEPGVRSATLANQMPLLGGHSRASASPRGREEVSFEAEYVVVGPDYFETMGIPVVEGRALGGLDEEPEPVVAVNRALASMFWPGEDAVGQQIEAQGRSWRVVGVVGDVQMRSLRSRANPAVYYPLSHAYSPYQVLHVAGSDGAGLTPDVARRIIADVDPQLPVSVTVDLEAAAIRSMAETRTIGMLVGAFAILALVLAVVGLYGLVSYAAAQRVRELGIRMALGAEPRSLVRLVLRRGVGITMVGIVAGLGVASGLGWALQGLLFGVRRAEPAVLMAAASILFSASALAAWIPARRASRVDAAVSLRD